MLKCMFARVRMCAGATSIERYELRTNTWTQTASVSGRRLQFGAAFIDGRLYVVGGRDGLKTLNTFECYDCERKAWALMPPMATHRHGLGEGQGRAGEGGVVEKGWLTRGGHSEVINKN